MSANTRELFHKLSPERQNEIMQAILAEIAEKNLSGATVRGIAKRLGISHGSLFHYFQSKEAMVDELVTSGYLFQDEAFRLGREEDLSSLDRIVKIIEYSLHIAAEKPELITFWLELGLPANENYSEVNIGGELSSIRQIRRLIEDGIHSGEFRSNLELNTTVFMVDQMISGLLKCCVSKQEKLKFAEYFGNEAPPFGLVIESFRKTLRFLLSGD